MNKTKWPQILEPGEYRIQSKENQIIRFITNRITSLHMLNIFRNKQEFKHTQDLTGLHFALKISQELHFSCTPKQILSHGLTQDGITYSQTRFGNIFETRADHSQQFLATLKDHGLESHILMQSSFRSYTYACIMHSHKSNFYSFDRPSNRRK